MKPVTGIRTGFDLERKWLGYSAKDLPIPNKLNREVSLWECLLKQAKDWNPLRPKTDFTQRLHYEVGRHLSKSKKEQLGLYVSVGNSLDRYWGVDCFFFLGNPRDPKQTRETRRFFTIDICLYPKPISEIKAQLLITPDNILGERHDLRKMGLVIARYFRDGKWLRNPAHFNPESWRARPSNRQIPQYA